MIHAICDFCGRDCDRTATLIVMKPFQNYARYHTDTNPFGEEGESRSFVMCSECMKKHDMPNPYESYTGVTDQKTTYNKCLNNYTDVDLVNDK